MIADRLYPPKPAEVYFFGTCLVDLIYPEAGLAAVELIEREGVRVIYPQGQTCCGQPAFNGGYREEARAVAPWIAEFGVRTAITGRVPALDPLQRDLESLGVKLGRYDRLAETQQTELFNTDLGITTSFGAIAETGSIVLMPSAEEPRLLSLAVPIHLAIVEQSRLVPRLDDFIRSGAYQNRMPANLVLVAAHRAPPTSSWYWPWECTDPRRCGSP